MPRPEVDVTAVSETELIRLFYVGRDKLQSLPTEIDALIIKKKNVLMNFNVF
jgi:hypothetical protein